MQNGKRIGGGERKRKKEVAEVKRKGGRQREREREGDRGRELCSWCEGMERERRGREMREK